MRIRDRTETGAHKPPFLYFSILYNTRQHCSNALSRRKNSGSCRGPFTRFWIFPVYRSSLKAIVFSLFLLFPASDDHIIRSPVQQLSNKTRKYRGISGIYHLRALSYCSAVNTPSSISFCARVCPSVQRAPSARNEATIMSQRQKLFSQSM